MRNNKKIDFVVTWVDGSDPKLIEEKSKYVPEEKIGDLSNRYRELGLFKYWFRAVEQNAPWVNNVYLVTNGQIPSWLNVNHPKIKVISHKEYIDEEFLPTFNSHTIELNLHRIKGLSEYFVYFNDDIFLNAKTKPNDFFKDNLPCDEYAENALMPKGSNSQFAKINANIVFQINKHFNKRNIYKKNFFKYINPKYGIDNLRTVTMIPYPNFSAFKNSHVCNSYLKTTLKEVWKNNAEELKNTCSHRFRSSEDINQYIFKYWQYCTGNFIPRSSKFGKGYEMSNNNDKLIEDITKSTHKCICINDSDPDISETAINHIINTLDIKYPHKSAYES